MIIRTGPGIIIMTIEAVQPEHLQRLATWFGPSFPVGAFSYSHGLEAAFEERLVTDGRELQDWIEGLVFFGSARNDAILFVQTHRCFPEMAEVIAIGAALSPSSELRAETLNQGEAFVRAVQHGWPAINLQQRIGRRPVALPVAAGAACAAVGIPLQPGLIAYLHAFAASVVSAALRCMPIGQNTGLEVQAALEPVITLAAEQALDAPLDELGSGTPMLDWLSATHETQYSRLFRS